ncbi:hypothetical protein GCM10023093_27520 [Nemorincola caseinilytica]|uniref:Protein BatD n=2 Tax=Nemorincola caseinilytica TaxID=2054315 RepID=A0ABP8NKV9_9BACT
MVYAQNVVFTAVAGATKMGIRDQVNVQYTIRDAQDLRTVTNPSDADFVIVGGPYQSQSSNTSISGNRVVTSQALTLTYTLQPRREGTFTIPPIVAKDGAGHSYQSNSVTIQVVAGSLAQQRPQQRGGFDPFSDGDDDITAMMRQMQQMQQMHMQQLQQRAQAARGQQPQQQPQAQADADPPVNDAEIKKDLFIKVTADKSKVRLGEQVTISYKLYSRVPMQVSISKLPTLNGFWAQDFDIPKQAKPTEEVVNGKKFQVFLLKKSALFPTQAGTLELDPAEAKGMARVVQQVRRKMSDLFDPFGAGTLMMDDPYFNNTYYNTMVYKDVPVHLQSAPVKIEVAPLPDKNKPESFSGAVGNFSITGKIDKRTLTTDDVATYTLDINGNGNLKLIEAPRPTLPNGLTTYDPVIIDTITGRSTTISGSKIVTYVITPQTPGDYTIPPVTLSYFDPQTGSYTTVQTNEVKLQVKPGKNYMSRKPDNNVSSYKDIHDILKQTPPELTFDSGPIMHKPGYWSLYVLPMALLAGYVVWRRRDEELSRDTVALRKKRANKVAFQRLATTRTLLQQKDKKPFYEEISKAIWLYLSDKLSIPLSALSRETATEAMNSRKVPDDVQKRLEHVITECETSLYASGGLRTMNDTYEDAVKVISDLEDIFKA